MPLDITQHLKDYKENGFCHIPDFFDLEELEQIERELALFIERHSSSLVDDEINYTADGQINSIHRLAGYDAKTKGFFDHLMSSQKIQSLVEKFLDDEPEGRRVELFAKPAKSGMASPMHQDNFYWGIEGHNGLTIWCALDHASLENGGVTYIKGSHKKGLIEHVDSHMPGSSQKVPEEILEQFKSEDFITPILKPGDLLVHHSLTFHGSSVNTSDNSRRGVTIQFKGKSSDYNQEMINHYTEKLKQQVENRKQIK